jgi:hypothetical protein
MPADANPYLALMQTAIIATVGSLIAALLCLDCRKLPSPVRLHRSLKLLRKMWSENVRRS